MKTVLYVAAGAAALWVVYRLMKKESVIPDLGGLFGGGGGMNPDGLYGGQAAHDPGGDLPK